ncbi:ATP-binding protein, partial [Streptomyces sp. NPDC005921]
AIRPVSGSVIARPITVRLPRSARACGLVDHLPAGGTVTVHTEPRDGGSVLRVENTGPALPPDLVPTLTEPFRRGTDRVRGDEHAGVGLGLAIVHSVVRAHDGTLDLVPRPAGGLLVTVRLPDGADLRPRRKAPPRPPGPGG